MDALLSHCVRACGTPIDASLSPAPSVLCEDGRGVLYALGADGTIRCSLARHVNASLRFAVDENEVNPSVTPNGARLVPQTRRGGFQTEPAHRL